MYAVHLQKETSYKILFSKNQVCIFGHDMWYVFLASVDSNFTLIFILDTKRRQ